jgi:hypothetical protein
MHENSQAHPRSQSQHRHARPRLALLVATTLALAVLPVPMPDLDGASAWAKGNGGSGNGCGQGGGGGGRGGGEAAGGGGHGGGPGLGAERGTRSSTAPGRSAGRDLSADFGRALGKVRDALAPGSAGKPAREAARGRYAAAAGWHADGAAGSRGLGRPDYAIDDALTARLVARGWESPVGLDNTGFRNHGHRVSSMVEIAKALGYGAHVGALQANFGGPDGSAATADDAATREKLESEMAELGDTLGSFDDPESEEARAVAAQLAALTAELEALGEPADAAAWDGDWRTAKLDITGDGIVDLADLEAARALGETTAGDISAEPDAPTADAAAGALAEVAR